MANTAAIKILAVPSNPGAIGKLRIVEPAIEMSEQGYSDLTLIENNTKKFRNAGFEVHYTEIDFISKTNNDGGIQTTFYNNLLGLALQYGVKNFTVWGIKDDLSWLYSHNSSGTPWPSGSKRYPTLFNTSFQPKNCYKGLINILKTWTAPPPVTHPHPAPIQVGGKEDYDIFIVLGQSNSCGRGESGSNNLGPIAYDDYSNVKNENIDQWSSNSIISAKEKLYHLESGANSAQWGFGTSFARQYVREGKLGTNRKVLLIGCGIGGTAVLYNNGGRGQWNSSDLFAKSVTRITNALKKVGPNSVIKGILWHQGESDADYIYKNTKPPHTFSQYESTLTPLLNNFRTNIVNEINKINTTNQVDTDVKILMGGIMPGYTNYDTMTQSIKNIVDSSSTTNYYFVINLLLF